MKVLVAGSNGIIGKSVIHHLQNKHEIYSIGVLPSSHKNYYQVDLTDSKRVLDFAKQVPQFDILIFLTGLVHSKGKNKEYSSFYSINVQTLINLLQGLQLYQKIPRKIMFSSAISVYGEKWEESIYDETAIVTSKTPYARTKLAAENYLMKSFLDRAWILRFAPVYSNNFTLSIRRRTRIGNRYYCVGKGDAKLSLLSIDNINKTIDAIIGDKVPAGTYNLSDKKVYTYQDLLEWQKVKKCLFVPKTVIRLLYIWGNFVNNNFLIENSIKLCTNNIFPSEKISKYVNLEHQLSDIKCIAG